MSNIVVYTQDVPGEREWLRSKFPDHYMYETVDSGKWESTHGQGLYEMPFSNDAEPPVTIDKAFKSVYTKGSYYDKRWMTDSDLISNLEFTEFKGTGTEFFVITTGRAGTVFIEDILQNKYSKLRKHVGIRSESLPRDLIAEYNPMVFLVYRNSWWGWITSTEISLKYDYYHHHNIKLDKLKPFEITAEDLAARHEQMYYTWESWCNFRSQYPELEVCVLEFGDNIAKFKEHTEHAKISYNKRDIITNYDEAEQDFNRLYLEKFNRYEQYGLKHLTAMNVGVEITKEQLGL